jgi:hypothetical protein
VLGLGTWRTDKWVSHHPWRYCTLRRSYKSAFLLPEEEIQGLINLPQGW